MLTLEQMSAVYQNSSYVEEAENGDCVCCELCLLGEDAHEFIRFLRQQMVNEDPEWLSPEWTYPAQLGNLISVC